MLNINILLSVSVSKDLRAIDGIFDEINMFANGTIDFKMTLLASLLDEKDKYYGLFVYLVKVEEDGERHAYIALELMPPESAKNVVVRNDQLLQTTGRFVLTFENYKLIGPGDYRVEVYKHEYSKTQYDKILRDNGRDVDVQTCDSVFGKKENRVSVYLFKVKEG